MLSNRPISGAALSSHESSGPVEVLLAESVTVSHTLLEDIAHNLIEAMTITGSITSSWAATIEVTDGAELADAIRLVFEVLAADSTTITGSVTPTASAIIKAAEKLVATGTVSNTMQALEAIAAALTIDDLLEISHDLLATDSVTAADTISALYQANLAIAASATITGAIGDSVLISVSADDTASVDSSLASTLAAVETLSEGVTVAIQIVLDDTVYWAYVLNAETKAASNYVNYPFNSFAKIGSNYYGCTDTGIYRLDGDDDDGTRIEAAIRSGLMSFGTSALKRMDSCYLGYASDGTLILKVISTEGGEKTERHFELQERTADTYREARIKLGKGVKSRYWAFELANLDGADFDIESIQFLPLVLNRRLNSG